MGYKSETQNKNIAWYLPRPKKDKYKGGMPLYCEEWLIDLAEDILENDDLDILNMFCGMSQHGFRIDIKPEVEPDILCDCHKFPKKLRKMRFDLVLADPPYSDEESERLYGTGKINYKKWTAQADKVLRKGGLLVVYHKFIVPNPNPEKYEVVKRVFIGNKIWHIPRVAVYFQKKGNNVT